MVHGIPDFAAGNLVMVDAMAATSGGVEWSSIIKPILSASYGSVNKHDILELCSAINKRYLTGTDQFCSPKFFFIMSGFMTLEYFVTHCV